MKLNSLTFIFYFFLFVTIPTSQVNARNQEVVLKELPGWTIDSMAPGLIKYTYKSYYQPQSAFQIVHVLELDYTSPDYNIDIKYVSPTDSLSSVASSAGAIAGINGSYELDATFIKTNGVVNSQVTLAEGDLRFWKHEGAIFYNNQPKQANLQYGTNNSYLSNNAPFILSGAPMLIDNYSPVGTTFVGDVSGINLNALDYEDYRRHQGTRHPRTAVALTEGNKMLLIVVDGRRSGICEGMTAKELTQFIARYFNPKAALNIDGGGSSTMYIKDSNLSPTGVVNYPTDNNRFDHWGQRKVRTFILIKKAGDIGEFASGSGTYSDPYIITNARHLLNVRKTNWGAAINNKPYFKLGNDIDLSDIEWLPINNTDPYAQLHFDGAGHIIKNMTVNDVSYASFFGVLCGTCKNLGIVNANVSSSNGGGIIAGYLGIKAPTTSAYTGIIENCFTSGTVIGSDAVGGITGNIGKPDAATSTTSVVRNCYSTATVIARNTTNKSRVGGVAGIVWGRGVLENSYATGTVKSNMYGAGGVIGWTDSSLTGLVALNDSIINTTTGNIARIAAFMGAIDGVQTQGNNCWGANNTILKNGSTILSATDLTEGNVTVQNNPYDGVSKTPAFLSNPMNYFLELGWDFASDQNIWSQTMSSGRPIFQWLYNRADYASIDGHNIHTDIPNQLTDPVDIYISNSQLIINGINNIKKVSVYSPTGQLISQSTESSGIILKEKGLYLISIETSTARLSRKVYAL